MGEIIPNYIEEVKDLIEVILFGLIDKNSDGDSIRSSIITMAGGFTKGVVG